MAEKNNSELTSIARRSKSLQTSKHFDGRPISMELETDFTNTETKLVVLDFLSSQPVEHLTARNKTNSSFSGGERRKSLGKSTSDVSSHESYRNRYAKLAKSGKSLRKQYSMRLKRDLDEYLRLRGKSMDDLSQSCRGSDPTRPEDEGMGVYLFQRSYTEGEAYFRSESSPTVRSQTKSLEAESKSTKPRRKISRELKEGITDFNMQNLRHVEVKKVDYVREDTQHVR